MKKVIKISAIIITILIIGIIAWDIFLGMLNVNYFGDKVELSKMEKETEKQLSKKYFCIIGLMHEPDILNEQDTNQCFNIHIQMNYGTYVKDSNSSIITEKFIHDSIFRINLTTEIAESVYSVLTHKDQYANLSFRVHIYRQNESAKTSYRMYSIDIDYGIKKKENSFQLKEYRFIDESVNIERLKKYKYK